MKRDVYYNISDVSQIKNDSCVPEKLSYMYFNQYFNQLSGAARTQKVVAILFWPFLTFSLILDVCLIDFTSENKKT